ncbi:MAG: cytochrome c biogenesis protein CcsA [Anaerolineae bacterium]|nr:cytochrome c biogenesis protein CcsA [Anaerolineae bacterium]
MTLSRDRLGLALIIASAVLLPLAVLMAFYYAPRELTMGDVQRIFYFHVPAAWVGFFAFFVTFVASIAYLVRGERRWDIVALSSAEVGLTFITAAVVTGSLWARPVWGTYWTWEPRLTISAVQLLVYIAYVMLRAAAENPAQSARFSAVYGIVAFVTVPLSWFAIRWWRTIHPDIITGGDSAGLEPRMVQTLMFSLLTFTVFYFAILRQRVRLEVTRDRVLQLRETIDSLSRG